VFGELEANLMRYASSNARFNSIQQQLCSDDAAVEFCKALDGTQTLWNALQQASTPLARAAAWVLDAAGGVDYRDEATTDEPKTPIKIELVFSDTADAKPDRTPAPAAASPRASAPVDSEATADLRSEIAQRFEQLDELEHYEFFGLQAEASGADIKKAYLQAAKRYHPDALARAGLEPEVRQKANKIFAKISKAYSTLSNPQQRAEYDAARGSDEGHIDTERLANAETLYRKGEVLLNLANFKGAVEFLAPAVELWPNEADYCSALGWALYKKMPSEPERSREHLEHAVELAPENATASYRLSLVLRALGESADADSWLNHARRIDPDIG
jgi:tetratricopeptide (TPR) repeat protein